MAETCLRRNGGQGLHIGLAGMLVTNCLFQKSHYLFFRVYSYCGVERFKFHLKHGALSNRYVSLGIERQFFKMKNA